jgi:hypothetical protein
MTERTPTPSELAAYSGMLFDILTGTAAILGDAAARGESQEIVNQRTAHLLDSLEVGEAMRVVDSYLAAVEDDSPLHPMRQVLLGQVLARMANEGMLDDG